MTQLPKLNIFTEQKIHTERWNMIPVHLLKSDVEKRIAHRLNCLGSSFYFSKVGLRNSRLSERFHLQLCLDSEKEHLKEVIEVPRDHFKSTIYSESFPMWWALPFTARDEALMRSLGYGDEWIRWMKLCHKQDTRTLLVSENITNAAKLGVRIDGHYQRNDFFRDIFSELIPNSTDSWTQFSKTHKRSARSKPHGEGTFDYLGVGAALQSRHYDRVVQDDLVGKAAVESDSIMQKTIEYHKLLVGAFDSVPGQELDNDEIVVGNRWSFKDLNSWIRENEPYFGITNHSALGGCCPLHPAGEPLFPEEFTVAKLERFAKRLGPYFFSCQFLNKPIPPKGVAFDPADLRYFNFRRDEQQQKIYVTHEVESGEALPDLNVQALQIAMICDPNHAGSEGRCNHAIVVLGVYKDYERIYIDPVTKKQTTVKQDQIYLLDYWADAQDYDIFIGKIYELSSKWMLRQFYLETIAAQKYLKYHLDYRNRVEKRKLDVLDLKTAKTKDEKHRRIQSFKPIFDDRRFFCQRRDHQFIQEYSQYPNAATVDILDVIGYGPQVFNELGWSKDQYKDFYDNFEQPQPTGTCGY